ncbi:hypothetical protein LAJ57_13740, partial [Streptococcus pneumoniae]|uniref:hypothetical protein n=1 Tax=Streptococcus pneumoniae TaxID=1313 RepID=UPI001CBA9DF4
TTADADRRATSRMSWSKASGTATHYLPDRINDAPRRTLSSAVSMARPVTHKHLGFHATVVEQ